MKILIVDDHRIIRDGLRKLLETDGRYKVVGEAADGSTAVTAAKRLLPDVVLMDISMPVLNGIEATRRILSEMEDVKIIILSMHSDKRFIEDVFKIGAHGYLLKECAFDELISAVEVVARNQYYLSSNITNIVMKDFINNLKESKSPFSQLSSREIEVIQHISEGKTTAQIAELLNLSIKTVESHRRNIMTKLELNNMAELIKYAIREGLTTVDV